MASICEIYGKYPSFGKRVSYSHVRASRRWDPNIQHVRVLVSGARRHANVYTPYPKAGKIKRAPRRRA